VALPFSKTQIEKLGGRLVRTKNPDPTDLEMLQTLLSVYSEVMETAVARVSARVGVAPTSRVKNTGTIFEKLEREGGSWLKSIQDLAGLRIVADVDRRGQDELVRRVVAEFSEESRLPRVIDRREAPSHGYTAVHIVVFPDGLPVEVQVRTRLQHEWAEMFEKLADRFGRGIRYGNPPDHWREKVQASESKPDLSHEQRDVLKKLYGLAYNERVAVVEMAIALGDLIGAVEAAGAEMADDETDEEIDRYRREIAEDLADLRARIEDYVQPDID
jgi:ppGpp synthetase/RelA/SpoT-type nucleotidyltranferase